MTEPDFSALHQTVLAKIAAKTIYDSERLGKAALDSKLI